MLDGEGGRHLPDLGQSHRMPHPAQSPNALHIADRVEIAVVPPWKAKVLQPDMPRHVLIA